MRRTKFGPQLSQHLDEAINGVGRLAGRRTQFANRVKRAIGVGVSIYDEQARHSCWATDINTLTRACHKAAISSAADSGWTIATPGHPALHYCKTTFSRVTASDLQINVPDQCQRPPAAAGLYC